MPPTDDSFAAFWQLFPRKVAKLAAQKAWKRLSPDAALVEQIMAGLRAQWGVFTRKIKEGNGGYVPHPATWLNQRRWEDEAAPVQRPRTIDCEYCCNTGVIADYREMRIVPCSCPAGNHPSMFLGPIHAEDAL